MTTLRALLYADVRSLVNLLHEIRRSPGRALVWLVFALVVAAFIVLRVWRAAHRQGLPIHFFPMQDSTDTIVCGAGIIFGVTLAFGGRFAGLFAHSAEARFIIGSPATPFIATLYVQSRDIVRRGGRQGLGVMYAALFYLPAQLGAAELTRDLILLVVAFAAIGALPLARQLLTRSAVPFAVAAGWIAIVFSVLVLVRDAAVAFSPPAPFGPAILRLPAYHPGAVLLAPAGAQVAAIVALLAFTAALFTFVARIARDAYPELYELSMNRIQRTERLRGRLFTSSGSSAKRPRLNFSPASRSPSGVLIFVWRAVTEYRRTHDARATGLEAALLLAGGYVLARLTASADPDEVIAVASPLVTLLFVVELMRSAALANELRRPLFWLSDTTLFERLCALAVAQSWRLIGWFVLVAIGLAGGHAAPLAVFSIGVAGPTVLLLAVAVSYASYAVLPSAADQRGPMLIVRLLLGYVLLSPPVVLGAVTGSLAHDTAAGFAIAALTAVLEAAVLIGFAAWRLDRMSIALR